MAFQLPISLKYDIVAVLNKNKSSIKDIEIEVKIRDKKKNKNIKLLEENLIADGYKYHTEESIDYRNDNLRITYLNGEYYNTSKYSLMSDKYFNTHDLKLTIVKEEKEKISSLPDEMKNSLIREKKREKKRKSYKKDNFSIDITEINNTNNIELEVEIIDARKFNFEKLNEILNYIFDILFVDNDSIIEDFTFAMGRKEISINKVHDLFSKARDLEFKDLTNDGILQPFTISLKADGDTRFLYFHTSGIYLININKDNIEKILHPIKELNNSLFVGEIIETKIKKDYLFLPYDCLRYNNIDIKNHNYLIRYEKCQNIYDKKFNNILIKEKPTLTYENNVNSLNNTVIEMYKIMKKVEYDTDGIIFTPINSPYITNGQKNYFRKDERQLNKFLDVCKYKIPEDLTIDLLVKENGVYTTSGKFKGTRNFPVQDYSFQYDEKLIGKIIEFKPYLDKEEKIIYKPYRDRSDTKTKPNGLNVVNILWNLRHDPINLTTMEGKDNKLQRKYHNQIKNEIINNLDGFVIDIGSGKGGDLNKYLKNFNIKEGLFIEPNDNFIEEFIRRRDNKNLKNKEFRIIKGGGEETEKIITEIKNYILPKMKYKDENWNINMMISLSFFWKDKKMLDGLVNTITSIKNLYYENNFKGNVYFNFLTIEGSRLKKLFEERGNSIHLNDVFLRKIDENEVFVNIKDSKTVENQTEYFVYLNQLLEKINFSIIKLNEANGLNKGDFILSDNERTYSSLFVYGYTKFIDKSFKFIPLEKDDEIEKLPSEIEEKLGLDNLYRIATIKKEGSLKHSFLKLLSEKYRASNLIDRKKMAKKSPYDNFDTLPVASKVISKDKIEEFNKDKDKYILLLKNSNDEYEPIVRIKNNNIERVFS